MESTIASISTPLGKGAISIVRMSGEDALKIASKLVNFGVNPKKVYKYCYDSKSKDLVKFHA